MILKGKTVVFLGDSITEGCGVADIAQNRYDNVIARQAELKKTYNFGIGGTRIANQRNASDKPRHDLYMCARAYDLPRDADLIIVYGGVNDYLHGDAPIGTSKDTTPVTFWGAVNFLMHLLKTTYTNSKLVFLAPAKCNWCDQPSGHPYKRDNALPLRDYVDILLACGKTHGVPVLDLYQDLPINALDEADRAEFTADGLHFNDKGHSVLANTVLHFLEALDNENERESI